MGEENDHGTFHPMDGWPRAGCTCATCVELRSRPAGGIPIYELPDEDSLLSGLFAMEYYKLQQAIDGDYSLLDDCSIYERQGLTLLRSACLRQAMDSEARSQNLGLSES